MAKTSSSLHKLGVVLSSALIIIASVSILAFLADSLMRHLG